MPAMPDYRSYPISTAELERRWAAVRKAMDEQGIDILLMQNNNDFHGGYVKWFTDIPATYGGAQAILFPKDDKMIAFRHGAPREMEVKDDDPVHRGVGKIVTRPTFGAVEYTRHYHSDAVVEELRPRMDKTIGLVGTNQMAWAFLDGIRNGNLSNAKFVDATDLVDEIKAIKSPEEIEFVKACCAQQDAAMEAVRKELQPGKRVIDMTALAQYVGQTLGSESGLFLASTSPVGMPLAKMPRYMQQREIKKGDVFNILVENNGPGGMYCEISRVFVVGQATQRMQDDFAFTLEAQRRTLDMLVPGAKPAEIVASHNAFMKSNGKPEEKRLYAHGQGYDLVERPMIFPDETMTIKPNMNMVVHPGFLNEDAFVGICDNYMTTETGVSECMHKVPQQIFEIDA